VAVSPQFQKSGLQIKGRLARFCGCKLDYLTPEVEVPNQSGGKRPRTSCPQSPVGVPDIHFEVFFEITYPMSARHMAGLAIFTHKSTGALAQRGLL
jgi:hypothetical protein